MTTAALVRFAPLLGAPAVVLGVLKIRGDLYGNTGVGRVCLAVDRVNGHIDAPTAEIHAAAELTPAAEGVAGVARLADGTLIIVELGVLLSEAEATSLDAAITR